ncbi:hypothetical protein CEJ63_22825, partial [Acinetobacter baumannii]
HFGLDIDRRPGSGVAQFLDLGFQVGDGLLEVEVVRIHRKPSCKEEGNSSRMRRNGPYAFVWKPTVAQWGPAAPVGPPAAGSGQDQRAAGHFGAADRHEVVVGLVGRHRQLRAQRHGGVGEGH